MAAGYLGLTEAAARYDETRTEPFPSFAEHLIRGAILDELRRGDIMPRRVRQLARKVSSAIRELEQGGDPPSEARIAEALGVSVEHYRTGLAQLVHCEVESLDGGEGMLRADASENPELLAANRQTLERVRDALAHLEQRDVTILALHYLEELSYPRSRRPSASRRRASVSCCGARSTASGRSSGPSRCWRPHERARPGR